MNLDRKHMTAAEAEAAQIDVGLRSYMLGVYNHMTIGLALTGFFAIGTKLLAMSSPAFAQLIFASPLKWVIMLAPLGMVFFLAARVHSMSASAARTTFYIYAGVMGLSLASIFFVFTGESIARVFFITAAAFAGLSLYGYTTKKSLSGMGTFLFMGLIGILIASVVNIFLASTMMQFMISVGGVLVFAGLTAYDTQNIKNMYMESDGHEVSTKKSIMGALQLYLDFINMFLFMLQLFGNRE
ncbi:Bax inhibitor-1/YccA family protein [Nisaea denitrificans]|uniref:Bax inhibitor-1/YccA family protein n=1 Tax=Nisaea denitrificans TaxID=390877 RepID=UPI0003FB021F|nr:Bax inhibitor-1/YccA family protein [Nisaea denitrificans]